MITSLYSIFLKCKNVSTDTRKIEKNSIFFALKGENFNANKFAQEALTKGASYAVIDEEKYQISNQMILVNDVLETLQKLATYHRKQLNIPVICLTGSNGKTTTKELINVVLQQKFNTTATIGNLNNHIGVPLTLLSFTNNTEFGIVELGANHPKEIAFLSKIAQPNYGYITNFGKAHLEGFGSLDGVVKAKTELYQYLKKQQGIIFVNDHDKIQVEKSKTLKTIHFGTKDSKFNIKFIAANPFVTIKVNEIIINSKLIGNYNYNNIAVAIAIGLYFNIELEKIKKALENYLPTNNRSQIIQKGSNQIILDAYNANPTSMECAIDNLNHLVADYKQVVLGDMFEVGSYAKAEHQKMVDLLEKSTINNVYLIGENFFQTRSNSKKIKKFKDYNSFKTAFKTQKNATILIKASRGMALERVLKLI